jgi:hypothetical protein
VSDALRQLPWFTVSQKTKMRKLNAKRKKANHGKKPNCGKRS